LSGIYRVGIGRVDRIAEISFRIVAVGDTVLKILDHKVEDARDLTSG